MTDTAGLLSILWHYAKTKRRQFKDVDALRYWQNQKVQKFLSAVLPRSPFYRQHFQGLPITDWQQFPTINKAIMMANFDALNTVGISQADAMAIAQKSETSRDFRATLKGYTVGLSSGTSGNRGLFLVSTAEQRAWAGTILAKALPRPIWSAQRIVFFLRANSNLYETVKRQHIQFEYFDLFQPVEDHIARLNDYQPTSLVAPPSMLRLLSDALTRSKLSISPEKIVSVAEVLDPFDQKVIQQAFQQTVHQLYQCTEGFLAATCSHGTLHLNEDILVIQKDYLDEAAGKFAPIITDFNRVTQPIIRYRLDDILTERKTPCTCGSLLTPIEQIEGRCDDVFYLKKLETENLMPVFPDFIRRAIILASDEIEEYAAVQKAPDRLQIQLQTDAWKRVTARIEENLQKLFQQQGAQLPILEFAPYAVRSQHAQKLRRVRREFAVPSSL